MRLTWLEVRQVGTHGVVAVAILWARSVGQDDRCLVHSVHQSLRLNDPLWVLQMHPACLYVSLYDLI